MLSDIALEKIGRLYKIERELKEQQATAEEIGETRQKKSLPRLNELKRWVDDNRQKIPKDSLTGKAFTYLINQWKTLIVYCENGRLNISNIFVENAIAIRPFAIGRKNWLFSDTAKGAGASAIYYSLIETAKVNGVEPYDYLTRVLRKLPYATTVDHFEMLLPWNLNKESADSQLR